MKGQRLTLTLRLFYSHCLIRLNISNTYKDFGFNSSTFLDFSHLNAFRSKFDLDVLKVGQSQPRIMVGPTSAILHTKSQGHWLSGSDENDF